MEKLLTIVVPIYKVEKYINKCLDSLILPEEQMQQLEVIGVNDGTPDRSADMAKEYCKRFPDMIKIIDKENGGHGSAWNKGVELATGKYLRFLDSDDWLTNLSVFMEKLEKVDADLVFTGLRQVFEDGKKDLIFMGKGMEPDVIYDTSTYDWSKTNRMYRGYNVTNFHSCTYKTTILKQNHPVFLEKMFYDDEILFILPLCFAKSFVYFDLILYNYLLGRVGQTMDRKTQVRNLDFKIKIRKYETLFYKNHLPQSESINKKLIFNLNSRHNNTLFLMTALPYKESIRRMKEMKDWLSKEFLDFQPRPLFKQSPTLYWLSWNAPLKYIRTIRNFLKSII